MLIDESKIGEIILGEMLYLLNPKNSIDRILFRNMLKCELNKKESKEWVINLE